MATEEPTHSAVIDFMTTKYRESPMTMDEAVLYEKAMEHFGCDEESEDFLLDCATEVLAGNF